MDEKGTSDVLLKFLQSIRNQLNTHFHERELEKDTGTMTQPSGTKSEVDSPFERAMVELENDSKHLDMVQDLIREVIQGKYGLELMERSREVGFLLQDLVHLHRSAGSLIADGWIEDDVNIKKFLQGANPLTGPSTAGVRSDVPSRAAGASTPMRLGMSNALTNGRPSL